MPTYIYVCRNCESTFERFQKMIDKPIKKCPDCGFKVERLITGGGGVIFKGNGFYCTDYRSDQYKEEARKDSSAESTSTKTSDSNGSGKGDNSN
jgi:putative FmdB family regulatory protein